MLALRKAAAEPGLRLEEVPVPEPAADEVLVEVETASVCGTDLHIYGWDEWSQQRIAPAADARPRVRGHGRRDAASSSATSRVGDYVSAESHITCGMCFQCRTGHAHMCERTRILGVDRDGAFARYVAVPGVGDLAERPRRSCRPRSPRSRSRSATPSSRPASRTSRAARSRCSAAGRSASSRSGSRAPPARRGDGRRPHAVPARPRARRWARARAVNVDETPDDGRLVPRAERGLGFDVVFEMSGSPRAIADAFRIARNGGRVILFGIPSRPVEIDVAEALIFKNLNVLALNGRQIFETWYRTRWLLESGVVDLRPLITQELPLEEFEEAFALLSAGEACKIVALPGRARARRAGRARARARCRPRGGGSTDERVLGRHSSAPSSSALREAGTYKRFNTLRSPQGAGRRDGGPRRGARPLVEQLPRAGQPAGGGRGRDRGAAPLRRGHRVGALHLRDVRAAPRARARARRRSSAPRRRSPTSPAGTRTRR